MPQQFTHFDRTRVRRVACGTICLVVFWSFLGCSAAPVPPDERPATWAAPQSVTGVDNFHQINTGLYRGAQPMEEGFRSLKKMGIKTVINLRNYHSDADKLADAGAAGAIQLVEIPMDAWNVTEEEIVAFLEVATNPSMQPVFFHCKHGSDRTGTMTAAYRIVVDGWSKAEALDEMTRGGFGFHSIWRNLPPLIEKLDASAVRAQLAPATK